ncbi:MAG: hypothetical protein AAB453_02605, partial [Patescibacteria group bacterium]
MSLDLCELEKKSWRLPYMLLWMWLSQDPKRKNPLQKMRMNGLIASAMLGTCVGISVFLLGLCLVLEKVLPPEVPVIPGWFLLLMFVSAICCAIVGCKSTKMSCKDQTGFSKALEKFVEITGSDSATLARMNYAQLSDLSENILYLKAWHGRYPFFRTPSELINSAY